MPLFSTFPVNDVIHTVSAVVFLADIVRFFHHGATGDNITIFLQPVYTD